jgi:hypothetical protein
MIACDGVRWYPDLSGSEAEMHRFDSRPSFAFDLLTGEGVDEDLQENVAERRRAWERLSPSGSRDSAMRLAELQEIGRPSSGVPVRIGASHEFENVVGVGGPSPPVL